VLWGSGSHRKKEEKKKKQRPSHREEYRPTPIYIVIDSEESEVEDEVQDDVHEEVAPEPMVVRLALKEKALEEAMRTNLCALKIAEEEERARKLAEDQKAAEQKIAEEQKRAQEERGRKLSIEARVARIPARIAAEIKAAKERAAALGPVDYEAFAAKVKALKENPKAVICVHKI
jgi:hypothetical protein